MQLLANLKIDPATSLARAYASFDGSLAYFEQQIASYEGRRRRLRLEFNASNDRATLPFSEAEVLE